MKSPQSDVQPEAVETQQPAEEKWVRSAEDPETATKINVDHEPVGRRASYGPPAHISRTYYTAINGERWTFHTKNLGYDPDTPERIYYWVRRYRDNDFATEYLNDSWYYRNPLQRVDISHVFMIAVSLDNLDHFHWVKAVYTGDNYFRALQSDGIGSTDVGYVVGLREGDTKYFNFPLNTRSDPCGWNVQPR